MKILLSILFNAGILFALVYFLDADSAKNISAGIQVEGSYTTYLLGGIILGVMNIIIRPILKILTLPLFLVFLWLVHFIINGLILYIFDIIINDILLIEWISYKIIWWSNFVIAVAIFTILNMVYSILFSKK